MQTLNESHEYWLLNRNKVMTDGSMTKRWVDRKKDGQTDGRMDGHMDGLCKNIMAGHLSVEEYENVSNFCNAKTVNIFQQKKKSLYFTM